MPGFCYRDGYSSILRPSAHHLRLFQISGSSFLLNSDCSVGIRRWANPESRKVQTIASIPESRSRFALCVVMLREVAMQRKIFPNNGYTSREEVWATLIQ
jgi:hypothetical protein